MPDLIDQYEQQLAADGMLHQTAAADAITNLKANPCRGCANLQLLPPIDAGHPDEHQEGYVLARPYCSVFPTLAVNGENGERYTVYRETWTKCPLHGINSVHALFQTISRRLDGLESGRKRADVVEPEPEPDPESSGTDKGQNLRWLHDAFKVLGLPWSADVEDRGEEIAQLWNRLASTTQEIDDGTNVIECRRGSETAADARYHYWVTRWSQDHFEIHDEAWFGERQTPDVG